MKDPGGTPDAAEFGMLRAYLAVNGFSQAWINTVIGTGPNGRTRGEITAELINGLRVLPKM